MSIKQSPLLSVVVPIGNLTRDYENLLWWISKIDTQKIEIILVLDQELQFNENLIDQLREKIEPGNLKVFQGDGAGPGSARNIGLAKITGTWTMFCDADDLPHFENVIDTLENTDVTNFEMIIGNYNVENLGKNSFALSHSLSSDLKPTEIIALNPGIWRICFRSDSLGNLRFPTIYMAEDQVFIAEYFCFPRKILHVQSVFYTYRKGVKTQLTNNKIRQQDIRIAAKKMMAFLPMSKNQEFSKLQLVKLIATGLIKGTLVSKIIIVSLVLQLLLVYRYIKVKDFIKINFLIWKNKVG